MELELDNENEQAQGEIAELEGRMDNLLIQQCMIWKQKAKVKWDSKGERCTLFFFTTTKQRLGKAIIS